LLDAIFKNIKQLEEFIDLLEENFSIKTKQVFHIIDEIKCESFFSEKLHLDLIQ
jgi:hypothetical protein